MKTAAFLLLALSWRAFAQTNLPALDAAAIVRSNAWAKYLQEQQVKRMNATEDFKFRHVAERTATNMVGRVTKVGMFDPAAIFVEPVSVGGRSGLPLAAYDKFNGQPCRVEDVEANSYVLDQVVQITVYPIGTNILYHSGQKQAVKNGKTVWEDTNSPPWTLNVGGKTRWTADLRKATAWQRAKAADPDFN